MRDMLTATFLPGSLTFCSQIEHEFFSHSSRTVTTSRLLAFYPSCFAFAPIDSFITSYHKDESFGRADRTQVFIKS